MKLLLLCLFTLIMPLQAQEQEIDMSFEEELENSIREFENRKIYTHLNKEVLLKISDEDLEQAIIDYIYSKIGDDYDNQYNIVKGLSKGFQAIFTTWWVEAEVNNGGYNQYFWNSTGEFAFEALYGFREIGAPKNALLMEQAIKIAIKEIPKMKKYREKGTLEAFSETYKHTELNDLDDEFFKYPEDLSKLRISYIRSNPELFSGN
ncbi:DMP19 family protein [Aliikangiella sp. IMCC44359]|uniref:DMP19 family protein n=1 Tax=Aliikangiella sp. IMCC44359 TaxID=3459125 RepID=UPI00403AD0FB